MPAKDPRLAIVCPVDIAERIKALAAKERRSVSAQVVVAIEEHLEKHGV